MMGFVQIFFRQCEHIRCKRMNLPRVESDIPFCPACPSLMKSPKIQLWNANSHSDFPLLSNYMLLPKFRVFMGKKQNEKKILDLFTKMVIGNKALNRAYG